MSDFQRNSGIPARPSSVSYRERGPELAFAISLIVAFSAWGVLRPSVPAELIIPTLATLLFSLATAVSIIALRHDRVDRERVTYWDVAGALTLCGLVVAAVIDPDRIVAFFGQSNPNR